VKQIRLKILWTAVLVLIVLAQPVAFAQDSYTYTEDREAAPGPAVYRNVLEVFGEDLGIGALKEPQDLFVLQDNLVYVADTGNNRIVVLDKYLRLVRTISTFDNNGVEDRFASPQGLFVADDGTLYVADYGKNRVVVLDSSDQLIRTIENPTDQELIPANFRFRPKKVVADRVGRVYVIAEGVLEGLMEFDEQGVFSGYIGAPPVRPSLWEYFWRQIMTDAQKERSVLFIPTEYSNADIDEKGFIYTTVAGGGTERSAIIRRLNPAGEDVLRRNGFFDPMGDVDYILAGEIRGATITGRSSLQDIVVWKNGIYSVVDLTRGRVFTYDDNGNMLFAFGAPVFERNAFRTPAALEYLDDKLLVLDRRLNMITMLEPTDYALSIFRAIELYQQGDYDGSADVWREVLKQNPNLDLAYSGIGRALLRQGEYRGAMDYYKLGSDREGYSQALALYRREWINANFSYIMTGIVAAAIALYVIGLVRRRRRARMGYVGLAYTVSENKFVAYLQKLKYALHVIVRPGDGFWDLKHEKRGDLWSATTILALVMLTFILARQYTGFPFNMADPREMNIYMEIASVLVPFFLWCGVNLALTSIMDGKGSFREIYITTAYALVPIILIHAPLILVSRVITLDEGAFYYVFQVFAVIWAVFLLLVGMSVIHDYRFGKNIFTSGLTVVGIGVVIFLALLFVNVLAQLLGFVDTIWTEVTFRI